MAKKTKSIKEVLDNKNPFVRDKWADYADQRLVPKYQVFRFDDKADNRFYYFKNGESLVIASGVTEPFGKVSIQREGINKWKEENLNWRHLFNVSSEYGTLEHILFGGTALGNGINKTLLESMKKIAQDNGRSGDMPVKDTLAFLKFQEDVNLRPLLIEGQLAWQCHVTGEWIALTVDMVAEMDIIEVTKKTVEDGVYQRGEKKGEPKFKEERTESKRTAIVLVDFKSNFFEKEKRGFYETHKFQLMMGKLAVEQNFNIKVDKIYNFSCNNWRTAPSYTLYEHKIDEKDLQQFWANWNMIVAYDLNKPQGGFIVTDKFENSSDYKMLSYKEYVENILLSENK